MTKVVIVGDMTLGETGLPGLPDRGELPQRPQRPTKPVEPEPPTGGGEPPLWPLDPEHPIAPPMPGEPLPPTDPPPGTIWPPLPPSIPPGKTLVYAGIAGVGYRYIVVDIPTSKPELPARPGKPDQGLPPGEHPSPKK